MVKLIFSAVIVGLVLALKDTLFDMPQLTTLQFIANDTATMSSGAFMYYVYRKHFLAR